MKKLILLAIFLLFTTQASAALVSWWKMDEASWNGTAGEVVDSYGTNHGTASGGATTKVGHEQRAGSFDGVDDYVSATNSASLNITGAVTVEAWINRPYNWISAHQYRAIVSKGSIYSLGYGLLIYDRSDATVLLYLVKATK